MTRWSTRWSMLSAWDRKLAWRAFAIAGVTALSAVLVIVTTDDGAPWARRIAMWGAIAPVAGALGTLGAARLAEARGELRALFAIGVGPPRALAGAVRGGAALALVGPCLAASPWADLGALFPKPVEARVWQLVEGRAEGGEERGEKAARAAMVEATLGVRVEAGGRVTCERGRAGAEAETEKEAGGAGSLASPQGAGGAGAAVGAIGLCAIACPVWVAVRATSAIRRGSVALAAIAGLIAAFQAVALGRGSPLLLFFAPLLLLADAALARYGARRAA